LSSLADNDDPDGVEDRGKGKNVITGGVKYLLKKKGKGREMGKVGAFALWKRHLRLGDVSSVLNRSPKEYNGCSSKGSGGREPTAGKEDQIVKREGFERRKKWSAKDKVLGAH